MVWARKIRVETDMKIFTGIKELVTMAGAAKKGGRRVQDADLAIIPNAAIIEHRGAIQWVGPEKKLKAAVQAINKNKLKIKSIQLNADCVLPGFIECHTHLIFAGDRKHEFELRNQGKTYKEIAELGGGIKFTVKQTAACGETQLLKLAERRAERFLSQGVTTLEVKSGYGLNERDELKILKVAKKIKNLRIVSTYLGPHAIPAGQTADVYLAEIINKTLPKIKSQKLADRVDMFIEAGYFNLEHAKKYFLAAQALGFRLTGHVEQMTRTGGGVFLADLGADSIDHLVQATSPDILAIAKSQTAAVLLPASDMYLKMKYPPARELIDQGACVAIATDFNPGTSPTQDLSLVGVLSRLEMKMKLSEVLSAYTVGAAHALNLQNDVGSIEIGKKCDFVVIEGSWRDLFYEVGSHPVCQVYAEGTRKFLKKS